ncbi:MAG: GHKL domain-containing protein [Anaerolineae bacterium]|nr:GHKL domain-containing protein [Anaerolineae bacterium]
MTDPNFTKGQLTEAVERLQARVTALEHAEAAWQASERSTRAFEEKLVALHEITIELAQLTDVAALYRRAIELARERLGFDRIGLFLVDDAEPLVMLGTFGTDVRGQVRDERGTRVSLASSERVRTALAEKARFRIWEDATLWDEQKPAGHGWRLMAMVWNGADGIGWLAADNLLTQAPLLPFQPELLALYGSTLGHLINSLQTQAALRESEERARAFQEKLKALHEVSLALVLTDSIETLGSKAIELGRSALGYDRLGILLFENAARTKVSRFGTSPTGELQVEYGQDYRLEDDPVLAGVLLKRETVNVRENTALRDHGRVVGQGWNVVTGIWDGDTGIGWIATDNLLTQQPLIPYQIELLQLYGLTIGHHVTRKRAEAALRQLNDELERRVVERTAQFEASNRELESFAYVVSHDLKAPLRAISQLASWLGEDYAGAFDADGQQMLDLMVKRSQHMHDLINDILHYSRIGRGREQEQTVDLNYLVQDVIDSLVPPPHIQVSVAARLPVIVGLRPRFEQVFQNLIGNAIKFMDKAEGRVIVDCQRQDGQWLFSIADNGPGIEEKYFERIFQIFQTLHTRGEHEGTGIGLALVKKSVEQWNGKLWVESTIGQGSTFYFTLPIEPG